MSNYSEQNIDVLEGLEAVRKRPGMYIGSTGSKGLHHLVYEIVDNSIDEALAGYCKNIYIRINENGSVTVRDDGRGIPTGIHPKTKKSTLETVLTVLHAGGKFGGGGYKVSGGLHGVGASVVNALSEYLHAKVRRENKEFEMKFERGNTISQLKEVGTSNITGTEITFLPDKDIFETIKFNYNTLVFRLKELAFLNKGITITFEDARKNKEQINTYYFDGGIRQYLEDFNSEKNILHKEIPFIEKTIDKDSIEFAFQYTDDFNENTYSYVNNINTYEGGTHLKGFKDGLLKSFNKFASENNMIDSKFVYEDIKEGLNAIISVKMEEPPEFEGQTKIKLGTGRIKKIVEDVVIEYLEIFFKENVDVANKLIERAIATKTFRESTKKNKELQAMKSKTKEDVLPSKLASCNSKNPEMCEVYIVEGDSAGGTAKQGRDRKFQAILPLRGKILNVEKQRLDKILSSETIRSIIATIGTGIDEEFDISKTKYHKIFLLVDADSDGGHIKTLLLTLFYRHMRGLLENGYVYIPCPPLYKNTIGKKNYYTYTEVDQKKFLETNNKPSNIQRFKGIGEMNANQLWDTTLNPESRVCKQVTLDEAKECDSIISMLMGDKSDLRKELLIRRMREMKEDV